jgi:Ca-activated chloride channel family protein
MVNALNMNGQDWQFQFAQWPWLLTPILLLLLYVLLQLFRRNRIRWQFPDATFSINQRYYHPHYAELKKIIHSRVRHQSGFITGLRTALVWIFISLCCVALARPEWVRQQLQEPEQYRDIVFVVDTSISMMQRDYLLQGQRVDRMTLLKGILSRFIDQLRGDNVSIVVYADSVYTLVPLTDDHELAKTMLARVHTGLAGRTSAMGNALAQAVHEAQQSTNRQRVLVLFTDATRLTGKISADVATEMARQAGLRVYTVAIGARTHEASEKRLSGLIYDPADIRKMEAIAQHTGGKFYWAGDTRTLGNAIKDIEQAERRQEQPRMLYLRQPLYQWPLLLAVLVFSLMQIFNLRQQAQI